MLCLKKKEEERLIVLTDEDFFFLSSMIRYRKLALCVGFFHFVFVGDDHPKTTEVIPVVHVPKEEKQ